MIYCKTREAAIAAREARVAATRGDWDVLPAREYTEEVARLLPFAKAQAESDGAITLRVISFEARGQFARYGEPAAGSHSVSEEFGYPA